MNIQLLYKTLRNKKSLDNSHFLHIKTKHKKYTTAQLASLATQILLQPKKNDAESHILHTIYNTHPEIQKLLQAITNNNEESFGFRQYPFLSFLRKTYFSQHLTDEELYTFLNSYQNNQIDDLTVAVWLMISSYRQLPLETLIKISHLLRDSGKIFDYRNLQELDNRKMIRRYPTGALSEKIALIMPSLISAFGDKYPIASNFLIAKSLGFTGGTWDKLSVIPGFRFPKQGQETIDTIKKCHVAMSVTSQDFNPLDDRLYQLRSATGSVESLDLITTSIASKLLAIPADFLLIDLRYGDGAFAKNLEDANILKNNLGNILSPYMHVDFYDTHMPQPNGMAIGNKVEVVEAITLMKNDFNNPLWDKRALQEQRSLIKEMFAIMLHSTLPDLNLDILNAEIEEAFTNGLVLNGFRHILSAHGIKEDDIDSIINRPESLMNNYAKFTYQASAPGTLQYIDQQNLGLLVNFELATGLNKFVTQQNCGAGVILKARLGDHIEKNQPLCEVFADQDYILQQWGTIKSFLSESFIISA